MQHKGTQNLGERESLAPARRKLVLAASTGGHLSQLARLAPQLNASNDSLWITFDTEQSRSLLAGRRTLFVPYIAPRDYKGVFGAFKQIRKALRGSGETFDEAVSTGAALALAALPAARSARIPARYIESVSRTDGPSLTGNILAASRMTTLRTQHESWATNRWKFEGNVLGSYRASESTPPDRPLRLFVTLGTIAPYRFDSMIDAVLATGLATEETIWQVGCSDRTNLPGSVVASMPDSAFESAIRDSDVVITHSGVGTIMRALECGKSPVVVSRRKYRNEHVDDHQTQIAKWVSDAGLAVSVESEQLSIDDIHWASSRIIDQAEW
ncbi:glycosyltransferase [Rhodococcus sp. ARC_M6]|uniref:glycosyltransferase n=1 Tax=Rhodococcus sp. ARC_M6 TaxID=2928852 RepID=UPI001FB433E5|nr:glycosyltransferase [Rhodococcus sp. ARC_M6]MCJ0902129.1 glycosyltransferase [Rhodococcus sp. ARC_M6]